MLDASMWIYLLQQAKGQLSIIYHTEELNNVFAKQKITIQQKEKILLIQEVKKYAEDNFGLTKTNNYSRFYDQKGKPILWMLTACEPFSFEEKLWHFPFLGDVSYKGFFKYELVLNEAIPLKIQHYDVDIGKVSAWSTLGILSDPILSSMLNDDEGELCELIIHELTHSTVYLSNNVDFNENFASFIGQQGAIKFITQKYGTHSKQLADYLNDCKEEGLLKSFLLQKKEELSLFYRQFEKLNAKEKINLKAKKMDEIINQLYALELYNWKTKIRIAYKIRTSGNAYFMVFNRYDAQYEKLLASYKKCNSNLKLFIKTVKQKKTFL